VEGEIKLNSLALLSFLSLPFTKQPSRPELSFDDERKCTRYVHTISCKITFPQPRSNDDHLRRRRDESSLLFPVFFGDESVEFELGFLDGFDSFLATCEKEGRKKRGVGRERKR